MTESLKQKKPSIDNKSYMHQSCRSNNGFENKSKISSQREM